MLIFDYAMSSVLDVHNVEKQVVLNYLNKYYIMLAVVETNPYIIQNNFA